MENIINIDGVKYIRIEEKEFLTLDELRESNYEYYLYDNNNYEYRAHGIMYLIIDNVNVLKGLKATSCYLYDNNNYKYTDDGICGLVINGVNVLEGLNAYDVCHLHDSGGFDYRANYVTHYIDKINGKYYEEFII